MRGLGFWELTFNGQRAVLKHEKGIFYVAWLLYNPPEHPIHALDLMARVPEIYRQQLGLPGLVDQITGQAVALQSHARLQERSLAVDDREAMRRLYRKERELEAILESDASEPEKAEALRELEAIVQFQRGHSTRTRAAAQQSAETVRLAINRFHRNLSSALDREGKPHPVLRPFALYLETTILRPSRGAPAGCLMYDPPPGCCWG
jgi:hypothetical protein